MTGSGTEWRDQRDHGRPPQLITLPEAAQPVRPEGVRERAKFFALILIGFIAAGSFLLATPYTTESGDRTPVIDSMFTSVSAVAVTGLVTVDTATHWNAFGQAIILALIQIGGLGFMVGAGILFQIARGGRTTLRQALLMREGSSSLNLQEAVLLSRHIAVFTFLVEGVGWLVLAARFSRDMPIGDALWHGLFHAVSAFCNAGFDLQGEYRSLAGYRDSVTVNVTVMLLIQAGALSFLVFRDVFASLRQRVNAGVWAPLGLDAMIVLIGNAILIGLGIVAMLALEWNGMLAGMPHKGRVLAAGFQAVSARTAGFATVDWAIANPITEFIWMALMMIGGASGSTAGGVKIATFAVVVIAVLSTFRGEEETEVFHRRLMPTLVTRSMAVIAAFLLIHFSGTLALSASEHFIGNSSEQFIDLLFESMSALGTVGLSAGITPELTGPGKLVLCVLMFIGRLGPLTLGYALQRRAHPHRYRYPVGDIRIG